MCLRTDQRASGHHHTHTVGCTLPHGGPGRWRPVLAKQDGRTSRARSACHRQQHTMLSVGRSRPTAASTRRTVLIVISHIKYLSLAATYYVQRWALPASGGRYSLGSTDRNITRKVLLTGSIIRRSRPAAAGTRRTPWTAIPHIKYLSQAETYCVEHRALPASGGRYSPDSHVTRKVLVTGSNVQLQGCHPPKIFFLSRHSSSIQCTVMVRYPSLALLLHMSDVIANLVSC